jgi:hypothetical protein
MKKSLILSTLIVIFCSEICISFELPLSPEDINDLGPLTIFEIQYTLDPNGNSNLNGCTVDCFGGVVTSKAPRGTPRLIIQDPNFPDGWGAIQVKDLNRTGVFDDVNVGDWISLSNVLVEEYKGTTFLQYIEETNPGFSITNTDNQLPEPLVVDVNEILSPMESLDASAVTDHNSEKFESMLIMLTDVTVIDLGYGKAYDNYVLQSVIDPNCLYWASDYMNADKEKGLIYHPFVETGLHLSGLVGFVEQYTSESDGIFYDYYQVLTTSSDDFITEQIADLNNE